MFKIEQTKGVWFIMEFLEQILEPIGMADQAQPILSGATNVLLALIILIVGFWTCQQTE